MWSRFNGPSLGQVIYLVGRDSFYDSVIISGSVCHRIASDSTGLLSTQYVQLCDKVNVILDYKGKEL